MLLSLKYPKKILGSRYRLTEDRGCRWRGALTRRSTTVGERTDEGYSGIASARTVHLLQTARSQFSLWGNYGSRAWRTKVTRPSFRWRSAVWPLGRPATARRTPPPAREPTT